MKKLIPLLFIPFCLIVIACNAQDNYKTHGEEVVVERAVPSFQSVVLSGGGSLFIHHSADTKIVLEGASSCVEKVNTHVRSDVLHISPTERQPDNCHLTIHLYTPDLAGVTLNGGGRVEVEEGFAAANEFRSIINGGGEIDISSIWTEKLFASVNGGGRMVVRVKEFLNGKIRGGGAIYYKGEPEVKSDISGGGTIKKQ